MLLGWDSYATSNGYARLPSGGGRTAVRGPTAQRRVIINTDAKNEADDQFAIVHALLSPTVESAA